MIRIANLNIMINLNITGGHHSWAFSAQGQLGFFLTAHDQSNTLQVKQDFDDIFLHPLNRTVLMQHTINFYFGDSRTRHGGKQDTTKRITESMPESTLKGLQRYLGAGAILLVDINYTRGQKFVHCTLHCGTCLVGWSISGLLGVKFDDQIFIDLGRQILAVRHCLEYSFQLLAVDFNPLGVSTV